jgi:hypothetical protein
MKARLKIPVAFALLVAASAPVACLDFTPITLAPTDAGAPESSAVESGIVDIDAAACEACVEGPQCNAQSLADGGDGGGSLYMACISTPKCEEMFECGASRGCYEPGANLIACLTICGQQAGLTGSTDPAISPFLELYDCATANCTSACSGP